MTIIQRGERGPQRDGAQGVQIGLHARSLMAHAIAGCGAIVAQCGFERRKRCGKRRRGAVCVLGHPVARYALAAHPLACSRRRRSQTTGGCLARRGSGRQTACSNSLRRQIGHFQRTGASAQPPRCAGRSSRWSAALGGGDMGRSGARQPCLQQQCRTMLTCQAAALLQGRGKVAIPGAGGWSMAPGQCSGPSRVGAVQHQAPWPWGSEVVACTGF